MSLDVLSHALESKDSLSEVIYDKTTSRTSSERHVLE